MNGNEIKAIGSNRKSLIWEGSSLGNLALIIQPIFFNETAIKNT
jgi:hypothetical protein